MNSIVYVPLILPPIPFANHPSLFAANLFRSGPSLVCLRSWQYSNICPISWSSTESADSFWHWANRLAIDDGLLMKSCWHLALIQEVIKSSSLIYWDVFKMDFGFESTTGFHGHALTNLGGSFIASWLIALGSGCLKVGASSWQEFCICTLGGWCSFWSTVYSYLGLSASCIQVRASFLRPWSASVKSWDDLTISSAGVIVGCMMNCAWKNV